MADRVEWFDVTIPAGTPLAAPVTIPLVFPDGIVIEIDAKILDGPCGSVGFRINAGGSQYVPRTLGAYIRPNDDYFTWPMANAINSGSWGITAYNLDSWDHNIQVAFQVNETPGPGSSQASALGTSADTALTAAAASSGLSATQPDPLSPDALINSLPLGVVTSDAIPTPDITDFTGMSNAGTP